MNSQINLLGKKEDTGLKERKKIRILRIASIVFLSITALTIIVLIIFYSQLNLDSIKKDQEYVARDLSLMREKSAKLMAINDRARFITEILKKRKDYEQTAVDISDNLTESITMGELSISSEGINMSLSTASLYDCKVFIDKIIALAEEGKKIKGLTIDSFIYDTKSNKHNLTISTSLP